MWFAVVTKNSQTKFFGILVFYFNYFSKPEFKWIIILITNNNTNNVFRYTYIFNYDLVRSAFAQVKHITIKYHFKKSTKWKISQGRFISRIRCFRFATILIFCTILYQTHIINIILFYSHTLVCTISFLCTVFYCTAIVMCCL